MYVCMYVPMHVCSYICIHNIYLCTYSVYVCVYAIVHKLNVRTIFVPQVVPEAAGIPKPKHEFPVSDVPQCKSLHTSYIYVSK